MKSEKSLKDARIDLQKIFSVVIFCVTEKAFREGRCHKFALSKTRSGIANILSESVFLKLFLHSEKYFSKAIFTETVF